MVVCSFIILEIRFISRLLKCFMRGSRKFCQRDEVSNYYYFFFFFFWGGGGVKRGEREDQNTTESGQLSVSQRNAISMALMAQN